MKKIAVFVAGAVFGIGFIIACSGKSGGIGSSSSLAASIGSALDVLFNNSPSGLTATNVQGALDEIDSRTDILEAKDLKSLLVGSWAGQQRPARASGFGNDTDAVTLTLNADGTYACSIEPSTSQSRFAFVDYGSSGDVPNGHCTSTCRLWRLFGRTLELQFLYNSSLTCAFDQPSNSGRNLFSVQFFDDNKSLQLVSGSETKLGVMVLQRR